MKQASFPDAASFLCACVWQARTESVGVPFYLEGILMIRSAALFFLTIGIFGFSVASGAELNVPGVILLYPPSRIP